MCSIDRGSFVILTSYGVFTMDVKLRSNTVAFSIPIPIFFRTVQKSAECLLKLFRTHVHLFFAWNITRITEGILIIFWRTSSCNFLLVLNKFKCISCQSTCSSHRIAITYLLPIFWERNTFWKICREKWHRDFMSKTCLPFFRKFLP
jgi:hypothetical protein